MKLRPADHLDQWRRPAAIKTAASSVARRWWRTEALVQENRSLDRMRTITSLRPLATIVTVLLASWGEPSAPIGAVKGYNDVPGSQSQPVWPESLIQSKEALVPPRLHHPVQGSFVQRASWQNPLVHHAGPHHIDGVGCQRTCQPAGETRAVRQKVKQNELDSRSEKA